MDTPGIILALIPVIGTVVSVIANAIMVTVGYVVTRRTTRAQATNIDALASGEIGRSWQDLVNKQQVLADEQQVLAKEQRERLRVQDQKISDLNGRVDQISSELSREKRESEQLRTDLEHERLRRAAAEAAVETEGKTKSDQTAKIEKLEKEIEKLHEKLEALTPPKDEKT